PTMISRSLHVLPGSHLATVPKTAPTATPKPIVVHELAKGSVTNPTSSAGIRNAARVPAATMAARTRISGHLQAIDSFQVIEYFRRTASMTLAEAGRSRFGAASGTR